MNAKELFNKVQVKWAGYGQYEVTIQFRNKTYKCHSNNSLAWDDRDWEPGDGPHHYTAKQAYQAFWDECRRKNRIGKYNY